MDWRVALPTLGKLNSLLASLQHLRTSSIMAIESGNEFTKIAQSHIRFRALTRMLCSSPTATFRLLLVRCPLPLSNSRFVGSDVEYKYWSASLRFTHHQRTEKRSYQYYKFYQEKSSTTLLYHFTLLPPSHFIHMSLPRQKPLRLQTNVIKGLIYYHKLQYSLPLTQAYDFGSLILGQVFSLPGN